MFDKITFYKNILRYQYLDILRGLAIVLMILFHLNYSLIHIFNSEIFNVSETFWYILGKVSALGFITIAGASSYLASEKYTQTELTRKYIRYSGILALCAGAITAGTALFFPKQIIIFGILHFFALSFLLLPFVIKNRWGIYAIIGFSIFVYFFMPQGVDSKILFPLGFTYQGFYSADYYPLIPYFSVLLIGYLGAEFLQKSNFLKHLHISRELNVLEKTFSSIGKRSLLIYLIHQPIIVGVLYLIF
ncbi:DUF1624 domain-containing protein [Candidatus Gracilibacteria bacterium]|nr:DUF1624 domain-containing protein [Candidatus Gracilibacteria bacterium]